MRFSVVQLIGVTILLLVSVGILHMSMLMRNEPQKNAQNVNNKRFFVYEWPDTITNLWPVNCSHHRISIHARFRVNNGTGEEVNRACGLYHTHQYSLFTLFYNRLLESEHRTTNPIEASLFFVPYDLGMDATTRYTDGALAQTNCPRVQRAMDYLNKSPYFQSSGGSDHFVLHSINQMMVFYANAPCTRLYELCFNCTKLSIDAYSPGVFDYLDRHAFMSHKWLSIPFPSTYHHSSAVVTPPWNAINRVPHYLDRVYEVERPYALCFVGSTMVTAKLQRLLRQELIAVCSARSGECFHVALETHQSHESIFKPSFSRDTEGRASEDKKHNNNPYSRAKLCLTPGGDFPTRKGFFDALLSGCVPVIFERTAALTQWPVHWQVPVSPPPLQARAHLDGRLQQNENARHVAADCVVYIPRDVAMRNMSETFRYLVELSRDADYMRKKLQCIAAVGFQLQYSLPGGVEQDRRRDWGPDAVDVIIDHLLK